MIKFKSVRGIFQDGTRWIKGAAREKRGNRICFCLSGAFDEIYRDPETDEPLNNCKTAEQRLFKALARRIKRPAARISWGDVIQYNDAKHRTVEEIQTLARRARI